jgi:hypothetical protein
MIGAMPRKQSSDEQRARDVLAAEEFGMPAVDPALHHEPPHDILAAEEFGVPDRDPAIHHGPVELPGDPTGIDEAHDVLAAEEFALPAGRGGVRDEPGSGRGVAVRRGRLALGAAVAALAVAALLARKRST